MDEIKNIIQQEVCAESREFGDSYKLYLIMRVIFKKCIENNRELKQMTVFGSCTQLVLPENADNLQQYRECANKVLEAVLKFTWIGSGCKCRRIVNNFRATSVQYYERGSCNIYAAPELAWNTMLK